MDAPPPAPVAHLLSQADELLRGLLENELIGVYVIQGGRFRYVNARLAEIFGYTAAEVAGRLGPIDLTAAGHRNLAQSEIDRRVGGEVVSAHYAFDGLRKDGSLVGVEVFGVRTTFDGQPAIIGMLMDISGRRAAERAAEEQLRFIARLIETIPNPVFYKDTEGRYLGCNQAFEKFIGIPRDELVGRSVFDISPPDLAARYHAADQALFDHPGTQTYEASVAQPDGSRRDVVFYKATFDKAGGSLGGLVGVILDITERKRTEELVWRQANHDLLTGLPNRRLFRDRLEQELRAAHRHHDTLALLFIDLDRFKEVNDAHGHDAGDQLLVEAGKRIRACVRESDTVGRLGGDEFTVLLPGLDDPIHVERIAEDIILSLSRPIALPTEPAYVSASVGIASYPQDGETAEDLMKCADQAMYAAKADGRNRFSYFTPALQQKALEQLHLGNELRAALAAGQIDVHYQPIVDLATGTVVKAEALARWHHAQRGQVSPAQFIPVAEEIGLIQALGDRVFRQAADAALHWYRGARQAGRRPIKVSVNKSPRQFLTGSCHEDWLDHMAAIGLPGEAVVIEITEGLLLDERPEILDKLMEMKKHGVEVSLDDFGTGYSAMAYLKRFDIDTLKIDQSFVRDLETDESDRAIAEAIIAMAHKLGMRVVAEGIETRGQLEVLTRSGCDMGQGYLFARPMSRAAFDAFLDGGSGDGA
ncbi:MAG TPA: EAL domain-containing protein [Rhodocyclaceae bacterium]|nr:EAL domain-containing protein [Rhodocyclaceae bacterium]